MDQSVLWTSVTSKATIGYPSPVSSPTLPPKMLVRSQYHAPFPPAGCDCLMYLPPEHRGGSPSCEETCLIVLLTKLIVVDKLVLVGFFEIFDCFRCA